MRRFLLKFYGFIYYRMKSISNRSVNYDSRVRVTELIERR